MASISYITKKRLYEDEETFNSLLSWATYDPSTRLFVNHDASLWALFEFEPKVIVNTSDADALELNKTLHGLLDSLWDDVCLQFSVITTFDVDDTVFSNLTQYPLDNPAGLIAKRWARMVLNSASNSAFPARPRKMRYLLGFRYDPPWRVKGFFSRLLQEIKKVFASSSTDTQASYMEQQYKMHAEKFNNFIEGKINHMTSAGFKLSRLNAQDLINILYPVLNKGSTRKNRIKSGRTYHNPVPKWDPNDWLSNQISETPLHHTDHGIMKKDKRYYKVVSVTKIPRELQPFQILPLMLLNYENILSVTISKEPYEKQVKSLERLDFLLSLRLYSPLGYNQKLGTQYKGIKDALQDLYEKKCQLVKIGIHQTVICQTADEAQKAAEAAVSAISQMDGARGMIHEISDLGAFINCLPGCYDPITDGPGWTNYIRSSLAPNLLPVFGNWKGSSNKLFILPSLWGRELIGFDLYDSQVAPNVLISGVSGAGKSYLLNYLICHLNRGHYSKSLEGPIPKPTITFIFDKGMQGQPCGFVKIAEYFGGRIYEATPAKAPPMNFLARLGSTPADYNHEDYKDLLDLCSDIILDMAGLVSGDRLDRVAVIESLAEAHRLYCESPRPREFILSDVVNVLRAPKKVDEDHQNAERRHRIANLLYDYYGEGTYSRFFDRPGKLELRERFIVFDLKALSRNQDLQRVFLKVAMLWADSVMNDPKELDTRKILVFDEAHDLIGKTSAQTVETAFRLYRKRKGIVIAASQSGDDFYVGGGGQALVQNSAHKIFLRQDPAKFHETAKLFNLSPQQVGVISQLRTIKGIESQFFLLSDIGQSAFCLPVEPTLYWLSTNNGDDNQLFYDVFEKSGRNFYATLKILTQIAPFGANPGVRIEINEDEELSSFNEETQQSHSAFLKGLK
ncbi:MAG: TraC family protein [Deltaproteobacteria bacterium]|nr:TraC family protein [Deltaproteobacteria bacterium]